MRRLSLLAALLCSGVVLAEEGAPDEAPSVIDPRIEMEEQLARNPYAIIPYRPTYILPLSYNANMTQPATDGSGHNLNELEIKYQISFKIPIGKGLLGGSERFYFGYTQQSFWQAYSQGISSPFRETDYEPELFFSWLQDTPLLGMHQRVFSVGIDHQSNGQSRALSRSWNRIYLQWTMERDGVLVSFRPWYRMPEHEKTSVNDAMGDDNPHIEDYMGSFELRSFYNRGPHTYGVMLRNNLQAENRGAVQLDYTYPLGNQVRGYVQIFNGYGESLLDYNHSSSRFSLGILLTDWL
jgi:phospholipase A1